MLLAKGKDHDHSQNTEVTEIIPTPREVDQNVPPVARRFLEQAFSTLHAPDAAAVMAGSAVDAMLKDKGYADGSLYDRIDKAVANHVLTNNMGEWAHYVRLGSNRPRHADVDNPHVSLDEARQSVEFADALAHFLYVLSARIGKGIQESKIAGKRDEGGSST